MQKHIFFPDITAWIAAMTDLQSGVWANINNSRCFSNSLYYLLTSEMLNKYFKINECRVLCY